MAENDIYDNKTKYEKEANNLDKLLLKPEEREKHSHNSKYYVQNKVNLKYFRKLIDYFDLYDKSYVFRRRIIKSLKIITYICKKDIKLLQKQDWENTILYANKQFNDRSKKDYFKDKSYIFKILFGEESEQFKLANSFKFRADKSRQKAREDKLEWEEYEQIVSFFSNNPLMQCYLAVSFESLGRPQEILYLRIKDVKILDNYARLSVSSHGKEGIKEMQIIDSLPYLIKWLEKHPKKNDKDCFLFISTSDKTFGKQMTPSAINNQIRLACKSLGINKPVTCYSLKRNGITFRLLRGDSDLTIMHLAGWHSTDQLQTYNLSTQKDTFNIELIKKGIIKAENGYEQFTPKTKLCIFCNIQNGFTDEFCKQCKRPLDRQRINDINKMEDEQKILISFCEYLKQTDPELISKFVTAYGKFKK